MRIDRFVVLVCLAGAANCGPGQAPVPDQPTWVDDVRPILEANCFHCHGPAADYANYGTRRWDFYGMKSDPNVATLGPFADRLTLTSPNDPSEFAVLLGRVDPDAGDGQRMPPPPATRLTARDLAVLARWPQTGFSLGQHSPNHPPVITMQPDSTFEISDADGDQLLGRLTCGDRQMLLPRSGGYPLAGMTPPCTVELYDGFGAIVTLPMP